MESKPNAARIREFAAKTGRGHGGGHDAVIAGDRTGGRSLRGNGGACAAGCAVVLSEDVNDQQDYGGVRVENPFKSARQ
jgi:hypothetical protein